MVRKVLFVTPTLGIGGATARLTLLADVLRNECELSVVVLGTATPASKALQAKGTRVEVIAWNARRSGGEDQPSLSFFNLRPLADLRRLVRSLAPEVVHSWGRFALWALLLGVRWPGRVFVSEALPPQRYLAWPAVWLIRQAGQVVAHGAGDAERYRRIGVLPERLKTLPPAVEPFQVPNPAQPDPASALGLPPDARIILGLGPIEPHKGFREAVWSFDILRHSVPRLHLVLVGPGSDRARVARFVHDLEMDGQVHLPGTVADVSPWLARAELVWVPSVRSGGMCAALEAMAAGRVVLASRVPGPADVVVDEETGILVNPGDKAALARRTRRLLVDAERRRQLGEAARLGAESFGLIPLRAAARAVYGIPAPTGAASPEGT
jgi:glycosyltransferase involved in cell wall biosynthesis